CFLRLLGTADRSTNGGCKAGKILPTNGLAAIITSWLCTSRIRNQRGSGGRRAGGNTSSRWWPNWQRPGQKSSYDCTVSGVDVHGTGEPIAITGFRSSAPQATAGAGAYSIPVVI